MLVAEDERRSDLEHVAVATGAADQDVVGAESVDDAFGRSGVRQLDSDQETAAAHIARGLALWTVEGDGCGREELAMRLYRFADDVASGGRLWVSTLEYARELTKAGKGPRQSP